MHKLTCQASVAVLLTGNLIFAAAGGPSIGVAMASGSFKLDKSEVKGNASLFEGSEVATSAASSKIRINGGGRVELGTDSQAKVFARRVVLEKGAGQVENPAYSLEALSLKVVAESKAIARVKLDGADAVLISAVNGPVRVSNASGLTLAKLPAGASLRFRPQAASSDSWELTGCLLKKAGRPVIVDLTTNQVVEIRSNNPPTEFGNRVTVKGSAVPGATPVAGASAVIWALSLAQVGPGGCLAAASSIAADPLPGAQTQTVEAAKAPAKTGGTNKAVIAGVAIAGGAGAGLALAMGGGNKSK